MEHRTRGPIVLLAAALACEGASRNIGGPQTGNGEPLDLVASVNAICDAAQTCCLPPDMPTYGWNHDDCVSNEYVGLLNKSEAGARLGRWADLGCFDRLAECPPPQLGCERPCKLFYGARQLGETCDFGADYDDCAQGLVCQQYGYHEWECDNPPLYRCGGEYTRCIDPCAALTEASCQNSDSPSSCGPDGFCDDAALPDDREDTIAGTCRPRAPIGGACPGEGFRCVAGAFCDYAAPGGPTCTAALVEGMPCTDDFMCSTGRCGKDPVDDEAVGLCTHPLWHGCTAEDW